MTKLCLAILKAKEAGPANLEDSLDPSLTLIKNTNKKTTENDRVLPNYKERKKNYRKVSFFQK